MHISDVLNTILTELQKTEYTTTFYSAEYRVVVYKGKNTHSYTHKSELRGNI